MTCIYEALTIKSVLVCHKKRKGYLKIWYLYVLSTIQLLQVRSEGKGVDISKKQTDQTLPQSLTNQTTIPILSENLNF